MRKIMITAAIVAGVLATGAIAQQAPAEGAASVAGRARTVRVSMPRLPIWATASRRLSWRD